MKKSISQNIGRNLSLAFLLSNMCMDLSRAETYFVEDNVRVIAPIALDALNRIKVVDDRIAQIFGNEDAFSLETDEQSGQIFIKPHNDKPLVISLVTEKEETIDLQLIPDATDAQTIILQRLEPDAEPSQTKTSFAHKLIDLMRAMHHQINLKGFTRTSAGKTIEIDCKHLSVKAIELYQAKGLEGSLWVVHNTSKDSIILNEKQFLIEPDIVAIALKQHTLNPNESTQLLMVKKNG